MRVSLRVLTFIALSVVASACKEEGSIKVHRLSFKGVQAVDEGRLKAALATHQSVNLPW